jgi:hypothetical protein
MKEAAKLGCTVPLTEKNKSDLMVCVGGQWTVKEACAYGCEEAPPGTPDACKPKPVPVCECFVQSAWCGTGAAKEAAKMGCTIPLLPEHNGDILYCPGGKWTVKQECPKGCVEAPAGTPDTCKSSSDYRLPFDCNTTRTCSNGNNTSTHTGKDLYAYDFAMPTGTTIRAMRGGKVLRVRNVSKPGDPCYSSGSSSCANLANTVEILHADGTVGLYMHLSKGTVAVGQTVAQGDILGNSGNSGWSTGPHLHVQVQQNCGIWWCQSVPFKFVENGSLSGGTSVKSQNCQ